MVNFDKISKGRSERNVLGLPFLLRLQISNPVHLRIASQFKKLIELMSIRHGTFLTTSILEGGAMYTETLRAVLV